MTIGYWRREARAALRATAEAMSGERATPADAYAVIAARASVYTGLARVVELLAGGRPVAEVPGRAGAELILGRHGQSLTRLYVGLRTAAEPDQPYPPAPANPGSVAQHLRYVADAIGVIGDILASHAAPNQRPRSPEGAAIRAGGGVQAALGEVARLTVDAIMVDHHLPAWLGHSRGPLAAIYQPIVDVARWSSTSRLGAVARNLIASAAGHLPLLDELDVARQPIDPAPAVTNADEATAAVAAARSWLWEHPDQLSVAHVQLATQLGLAVSILIEDRDQNARDRWRGTAMAAAELRGSPTTDVARHAAGELAEVLRWARSNLNSRQPAGVGERLTQLGRLGEQLPALASTMHRGVHNAVRRRDLFVRDLVLRRPAGSLIYRATERWRPSALTDQPVRDLSRLLWKLSPHVTEPALADRPSAVAAASFPKQLQSGSAAQNSQFTPPPIGAAPRRLSR